MRGLIMVFEAIATLVLGGLCFRWGMQVGRWLWRRGATANDLFKGKNTIALLFLGAYVGLIVLALNLPQMQILPLTWRVSGMRVTWTLMRVMLLGFCGVAFAVTWHTARRQVIAVLLLGLLGVGGFTYAEAYFLAPIHSELQNNLQPNGVFKQTSMTSCAPAALATVLQRWGIQAATEVSVAEAAGTSRLGTSMPQLVVAARRFGMTGVELTPTWEQMRQINRPGVLGVWLLDGLRKSPHAVALLSMTVDQVAIGDPATGRIFVLNPAQFARIWRQQYLPIYKPGEVTGLTVEQVTAYLRQLGYLTRETTDFQQGLRAFQQTLGLKVTGELNQETRLMLMGQFLQGVPTLRDFTVVPR